MYQADWLVIDWGTTNFRAFALDKSGNILDRIEKPVGLLQVKNKQFADTLENILKGWINHYESVPVYMAGMVGSAQGWVHVPYEETPASLTGIAKSSTRFKLPWGAIATIIPGVSSHSESGEYDVMRGEEVQLLGLMSMLCEKQATVVLPGTHSKHVTISNQAIESFNTYMTGELFSLLSKYSIIGMGLPNQTESLNSFIKGVSGNKNAQLANRIFSARTHRLFKNIKETEVLDYLSGILIGNEIQNIHSPKVYIVGSQLISNRYQTACQSLNIECELIDGDTAFLAGMKKVKEIISHE